MAVSKEKDTYETKMMKAVGNVYGEVVSWIEGNVRPDMRVFLRGN